MLTYGVYKNCQNFWKVSDSYQKENIKTLPYNINSDNNTTTCRMAAKL